MAKKRKHTRSDDAETARLNREASSGSETVVVTAERGDQAVDTEHFKPKSPLHDKAWDILRSMADLQALDSAHMTDAQRGLIQRSLPKFFGENAPLASKEEFDAQIARVRASYPDMAAQPMDEQIKFIVGNNLVSHRIMTLAEIDAALDGKGYPKPPSVYTAEHRQMYSDKVLERWQRFVNENYTGEAVNLKNPNAGETVITSGFGKRAQPRPGASTNHMAFDLGNHENDYVVASAPGIVLVSGTSHTINPEGTYDTPSGLGNYVDVGHADGRTITRYSELANLKDMPKAGQLVETGNPVGIEGATGISTGKHTHFEVLKNGKKVKPVLNGRTDLAKGDVLPATPLVAMKDRKGRDVPVGPSEQPPASTPVAETAAVPTLKDVMQHAAAITAIGHDALLKQDPYFISTALQSLRSYPSYADMLKGYEAADAKGKAKIFDTAVGAYIRANGYEKFSPADQYIGLNVFYLRDEAPKALGGIEITKFETATRQQQIMRDAREVGNTHRIAYTPESGHVAASGESRLLVKRIGESRGKDGSVQAADGDYVQLTYITPDGQVYNFTGVSGGAGKGTLPSLGTELASGRGLTFGTGKLREFNNNPDYGSFFLPLENPSAVQMAAFGGEGRSGFGIHGGEQGGSRGCLKIFDDAQEAQFLKLIKQYGVPKQVEIVSDGLLTATLESPGYTQLASADVLAGQPVGAGNGVGFGSGARTLKTRN